MQGNTTAFNLGEAQKRHIVVGCGLHRIVTPYLRQFVEPTMQKAYNTLKSKNHVHTQTFQNHIKEYNGFKLNYRSINNNNSHKGKAAEKKYDYRVSNPVDFAKLFLQPFMAHMTGFDDSCDMSALLGLLCNVGDFSQDVRDAASQVRKEVRNKWAHCDFSDWTQGHFLRCFQLMEKLVKSLKLPSPDEQKCVQDLQDWKQRGVQLIWGQVIDKDLLRVVQQDVAAMQSNLVKYKESNDGEVERLVEQLKNIEEVLAKTLEGQVTLRRDVNTIGESVTEIKDRVTTLEDDHGQVAEQVCSLEHREANVEQEVGAVAEKVENIDRSLTDFQQRQMSVHSTVAAEQEVQDERLQTLEKGQVKLQQRVDRVESWQQEVSENSEARRQEVCYSEDAFETLKHLLTEVRVEDDSRTDTYNRLARHVAESGLTFRAEVPKDGNCMFHAVSDQLFRTKAQRINHEQLRNQAVDFLRGHPYNSNGDHLRAFVPGENWERYLSVMSRDGTWGDHIVLQAMADMFGHDISIVSSVEAENYVTILPPTPGNVASEEPPLLLGHYAENHYASLDQLSKTKATAKRPLHPHHYHHWSAAAQDCVIIEAGVGTSGTKRFRLDKRDTDEKTSAFTSALAINYRNTLKTLKPLPWDDRFCLDLDKIFTRLVLVRRHQDHKASGMFELLHHQVFYHQGQKARRMFESHHQVFDHQMREPRAMFESLDDVFDHQGHEARAMFESLDDVFDHQPESGQSKRFNVLVVGHAGSGKSTLLSKAALDWSCKKGRLADMNKIVLLVRLREVEPGESIADIVWDQCVTETAKGISISSIETCLQDNESDVVFLLDGYDELVPDAKTAKQAVPKLLKKKCYPGCTVIVTSRPSSGIEQYMAVDCKVNVMGFSSALVDKYVPLYFKSVEKPDLADSLVKALDLKANIVARGLIQTPMFLVLICVLWEENPTIVQFPVTMSGLYRELLTCVIRKYCVREGMSVPYDEIEIPSVVLNALHHLGELALKSLLRGESLVDLGKTTANQDTDVMVNLGIVSKEVSASRLHPKQQLNFPHKSMQEFLAGRYVADRVNTSLGDLQTLVPYIDTVLQHQGNLVQFICGGGGKVNSEMLAKLNTVLEECENFRLREPLKRLCLMSLYEGNDTQHFPKLSTMLSSLDLDINIPSREGAALKFYLNHAMAVPEGRSLRLTVAEDRDGDAVEYLSSLVQRSLRDLRLYLRVGQTRTISNSREQTCHIGNKLDQLIPLLINVPNMRSLNLANTSLTPESIEALRQILPKLTMLEELDLSHNPDIGDNEIDLLSKGLESNVRLRNVNFSKVGLGDVAGKSIASVLHYLSCLRTLDLSHNYIGNGGLEPFAAIQQPVASLKELNLSCNKIGDVCLGSLAAVLHHLSCLVQLDLSHNNIGDAEIASLAPTLHHAPTLEYVFLNDNPVTAVGLQRFAQTIHRMPALAILSLDPQQTAHLDDTAAMSICTMLTQLPVLLLLSLRNIYMPAAGLQAVDTAVREHPTLQELRYSMECVPQGVNTRSLSCKIELDLVQHPARSSEKYTNEESWDLSSYDG